MSRRVRRAAARRARRSRAAAAARAAARRARRGGSGPSAAARASTRRPPARSSDGAARAARVAVVRAAPPARRARAARRRARARSSAAARRTAPGRRARRAASPPAEPRRVDRLERRVARRRAGGVAAERAGQLVLVDALGRHQLDHPQRRLGQGAGLVGAHDRDRGQRLDRVELLGEDPAPRHLRRRDRRGQRDEQDQALGDDVHDRRGQRLDRLRLADVAERQRDRRARRRAAPSPPTRMISSRSIAFSSGERGWRKARAVAASRAARLSAPTAVASRSPAPSTAKEPERTASPTPRSDRLGLAGQVRLVERQPFALQQRAVGDDLVAAAEPHQVADDDLVDRDSRGSPSRTTVASARPAPPACRARAWRAPPGTCRSPCWRRGSRGRARPWGCRRRSSPRRRPRGSG